MAKKKKRAGAAEQPRPAGGSDDVAPRHQSQVQLSAVELREVRAFVEDALLFGSSETSCDSQSDELSDDECAFDSASIDFSASTGEEEEQEEQVEELDGSDEDEEENESEEMFNEEVQLSSGTAGHAEVETAMRQGMQQLQAHVHQITQQQQRVSANVGEVVHQHSDARHVPGCIHHRGQNGTVGAGSMSNNSASGHVHRHTHVHRRRSHNSGTDLHDDLPELLDEVLDEHSHVQSHIAAAAADAQKAAQGVYTGASSGLITQAQAHSELSLRPASARLAEAVGPENRALHRQETAVNVLTERIALLLRENKALRAEVVALSSQTHVMQYEHARQQKQVADANSSSANFRSLARTTQDEYETQLRAWAECATQAEQTYNDAIKAIDDARSQKLTGPPLDQARRENRLLREKELVLAQAHAVREQLSAATLRHTQLRYELLEHKLYQQQRQGAAESAKNRHFVEQVETLTKTEAELRSQLALYAEKFEQFQETLTKSNDVFSTFKQEMERMSKRIKRTDRENEQLRDKCAQTDMALIDLAEERNRYKKQVEVVKQQKTTLEDLCRVLQNERKAWRSQQKETSDGAESASSSASPQALANGTAAASPTTLNPSSVLPPAAAPAPASASGSGGKSNSPNSSHNQTRK